MFIAHRRITAARAERSEVVLELDDGRRIVLVGALRPLHGAKDAQALAERICEAREAYLAARAQPEAEALVVRGGRTTREWAKALTQTPDGHASFRTAAITEERLLAVVENPSVDESARAGAAAALRASLDGEKRARLRVAAETSASPGLREALVRIADSDEETEAVLEALADAAAVQRP